MKFCNPASTRNEFSKLAKAYARRRDPRAVLEARQFINWIGLSPDESVLDAACGPGLLAKAMVSAARNSVFAVDISFRMLDLARCTQQRARRLCLALADVQHLPFASEGFDALTCTYSFANFPDPLQVLREFARVTRSTGKIGIMDVVAPSDPAENRKLNDLESSRSHIYTHLMTSEQFGELFKAASLELMSQRLYHRRQSLAEWLRLSPAIDRDSKSEVFALAKKNVEAIPGRGRQPQDFMSYVTSWFLLRKRPIAERQPPYPPRQQTGLAPSASRQRLG
ncbi:MAG: class I SAM-dependent methyltransferase [Terriglobia bacterium]